MAMMCRSTRRDEPDRRLSRHSFSVDDPDPGSRIPAPGRLQRLARAIVDPSLTHQDFARHGQLDARSRSMTARTVSNSL